MTTIERTVTLVSLSCGECGVVFALAKDYIQARRNDHRTWWCPNGHGRAWLGKNTEEQLREQLERAERERDRAIVGRTAARDQAAAAERSASAYRGHLTRLRNRIAAGVCPCCQRSFANVRAHIAGQHPQWAADHAAALTEETP